MTLRRCVGCCTASQARLCDVAHVVGVAAGVPNTPTALHCLMVCVVRCPSDVLLFRRSHCIAHSSVVTSSVAHAPLSRCPVAYHAVRPQATCSAHCTVACTSVDLMREVERAPVGNQLGLLWWNSAGRHVRYSTGTQRALKRTGAGRNVARRSRVGTAPDCSTWCAVPTAARRMVYVVNCACIVY